MLYQGLEQAASDRIEQINSILDNCEFDERVLKLFDMIISNARFEIIEQRRELEQELDELYLEQAEEEGTNLE